VTFDLDHGFPGIEGKGQEVKDSLQKSRLKVEIHTMQHGPRSIAGGIGRYGGWLGL